MVNDAQATNMGCWERASVIQFDDNVASFAHFHRKALLFSFPTQYPLALTNPKQPMNGVAGHELRSLAGADRGLWPP